MLSRLLLIFGLLMLCWQWGHTMPRHEPTTHRAIHEHTTAKHVPERTTRKTLLGRLTHKSSSGHATTTPSSVQVTSTAIPTNEQIPGFSGISGVSLFDLPPNCKPGHVATGPNQRCRLEV